MGGLAPWCFLAPYLLVFLGFFLLPALWSAVVSLTDWKIVGTPRFVGLKNYARLFGDPLFFTALKNTLVYTVVIVPLTALVGLGLALLLNQPLRGRVATRTAVFASYVVMVSVVGIIWRWVLDPTGAGIVNYYLGKLGVGALPWLAAPETAMLSIIIATMWWTAGYNMVMYLAGLQDIPETVREAAHIDGASPWQEFRHVTLPMLRPVTFFVVVMSIAKSFQVFGQVFVMTQGGPSNSTLTIVQYLYVVGFTWFEMGYAAAIAYALFALLLVVTIVQFRMATREGGSAGFVRAGFACRLGLYALMGLVLVVWVAPLLWMLSTSLKPEGQILSLVPRWIPQTFTLENYREVLDKFRLVAWGVNSLVVAAGATILGLAVSVPAAYAFARMRFRGQALDLPLDSLDRPGAGAHHHRSTLHRAREAEADRHLFQPDHAHGGERIRCVSPAAVLSGDPAGTGGGGHHRRGQPSRDSGARGASDLPTGAHRGGDLPVYPVVERLHVAPDRDQF